MALTDYIQFWNTWHARWAQIAHEAEPGNQPIEGLPRFPDDRWKLFPEPYWGVISADRPLKGVFLNINPGLGIDPEDARDIRYPFQGTLGQSFDENDGNYNAVVAQLSSNPDYITTKWMIRKRARWYDQLTNNGENLEQLLIADLFPWHTPRKGDLTTYRRNDAVRTFVKLNVIDRIASIAQNNVLPGPLNGKVIARCSVLIDLINESETIREAFDLANARTYAILKTNELAVSRFSSYLTVLKHRESGCLFCIFSDGASMELPNVSYAVQEGRADNLWNTLSDFLNQVQ